MVHVVNDEHAHGKTDVEIYKNTGAGAVLATSSDVVDLIPTWTWGLGYTAFESGEYWLRIRTSTEFLIPKTSFERTRDGLWVPVVSYLPGDFAVFALQPVRRRIW